MSKLVWITLIVASTHWTWSTAAQTFDTRRAKECFVEHDRNHDGYVTLEEVMGYETKLFNRMDGE
jgi:Ca2+-binding EF-hand superfamily protein